MNNAVASGDDGRGSHWVLSCSGLGGGAARYGGDGVDSGGNIIAPIFAIPNIERLESLSPLLWLWRRELPDSGGAGQWRGGLGVEFAVAVRPPVHDVRVVAFATSWAVPAARGVHGGFPGGLQSNFVVSGRSIADHLHADELYQPWALSGNDPRVLNGKVEFFLQPGDVWVSAGSGGGGFGDPRARDPEAVLNDVISGRCTLEHARSVYGVTATRHADGTWTAKREEPVPEVSTVDSAVLTGPFFNLTATGLYECRRCGTEFAADPSDQAPVRRRFATFSELSPVSRWSSGEGYGLVVDSCPGCSAYFRVDVRKPGASTGDTAEFVELPTVPVGSGR